MADEPQALGPGLAIYRAESGAIQFQVDGDRQTIWATQADMVALFGSDQSGISRHIASIFANGELDAESNMQKTHIAGSDKPVTRYTLDVVISVGYRVNSVQATKFRQWSTVLLKQYIEDGYAINQARLEANPDMLRRLYESVRRARLSEGSLYQKVRDIFKMSASDYDADSQAAHSFFALAQDKFHYAVTGRTAAQLLMDRADASQPNMGLTYLHGVAPAKEDVTVAKNYLTENELRYLENLSEQWMLYVETQYMRGQKLTMEALLTRINQLLEFNRYEVLWEYPADSDRRRANAHALHELETYRRAISPKAEKRLRGKQP